MYTILENSRRMSMEEIHSAYDGKWVFLINLEGELGSPPQSGIPIVIADSMWEGRETGIYKKYNYDETISSAMGLSLMPRVRNVFGFSEVELDYCDVQQ